jgi:hypothetical protein
MNSDDIDRVLSTEIRATVTLAFRVTFRLD